MDRDLPTGRNEEPSVTQMGIGEFARRSRLSQKALRLYDELGLLRPAYVDTGSGYRIYEAEQLERARLVASLRQIGLPLVQIKQIVELDPEAAAQQIADYWSEAELEHVARRDLATYLIDRLEGKRSVTYEVSMREIPERRILRLKRHVEGHQGAFAFGKEFVAILRGRSLPPMEGVAGAMFCIYHGEVSEDSDGPVEMCRPVPEDRAEEIAARFPELGLRTEPAHEEAFVRLGPGASTSSVQWQLVSESLRTWGADHGRLPSELGVRVTFMTTPPVTPESVPECDFAVPVRQVLVHSSPKSTREES